MTEDHWLMIAVFILGAVSLIGFFITKTAGFGEGVQNSVSRLI